MTDPLFSDRRRDLVARTLFDLLKIVVVAAFASKFFIEFSTSIKAPMIFAMVSLSLLGFFVCPRTLPREGS